MFDMGSYRVSGTKTKFLNTNAQFLALNVHTGQLMRRK
jgi:hypothetical protein